MDAHTFVLYAVLGIPHAYPSLRWTSDVSQYPKLDSQIQFGPVYSYEYNTRATYGADISGWGENDPLNATWWHRVTEGKPKYSYL